MTTELYPQIVACEQALLGAWLRRPSLRKAWQPDPAEFVLPKSQALAHACRAVADLVGDDLVMAAMAALERAGTLALWGAGDPLTDGLEPQDPIVELGRWRELRGLERLRKGLAAAGRVSTLREARGAVHEALTASQTGTEAGVLSDRALMEIALRAMVSQRPGQMSGYTTLDCWTGGLRRGHVWVLGAPTNWGKSSWLLAVADHCLRVHGRGVLYVTCEDDPELLATRLMCRRAGIPGGAARDGRVHPRDLERAHDVVVGAREIPLMVDGRGRNVEDIAATIRVLTRAHGIDLVLVDYLQCIGTQRKPDDRRNEINHIARTLTDAIKTSGAAGILASQLTGEDIRESRDVEHAAEVVIIGRKDDRGALSLFLKKNKTGPSGLVLGLGWDKTTGSFTNRDTVEEGDDALTLPTD
jgi:KaiC/GvpD/RAD55 family RecA-like ATPase